jgi:class 3 adenylate cyclase
MPYFADSVPGGPAAFALTVDPRFRALFESVVPRPQPELFTGRFDYVEGDLAPYEVRYLAARLRDSDGAPLATVLLTYMGLRSTLVSLLARGDETMYERMARLVDPARHQAAILFADLQDSGELSRRLPTPRYFQMIRSLATGFDRAVAENGGVVGKHAGDGMTGFFIVDGSVAPATAALGALRTARAVQSWAMDASMPARDDLPGSVRINIGLHWGANLYMGQVVPGGRLDVSALGDEVNECARLQETARDGGLFASKAFVELLDPHDAASLDVEVGELLYQPLGRLPGATEKAIRDAGTLAVASL